MTVPEHRAYNDCMQFTIKDAWLPATLTAPAMTDADFAAVCARYPELVFETTGEGKLVVMKPAVRNEGITSQLQAWEQSGTVFDSPRSFCRTAHGAGRIRHGAHGQMLTALVFVPIS